jgi:hypothetical protein
MKKEVIVRDAIMGSGKTTKAIESMKKNKGNFLYVTPFLNEVERILVNVPNTHQPTVTNVKNQSGEWEVQYKRDNLLNMANKGKNIATTHSLFSKLQRNDYSFFKDYDLILDEVLTPIEIIKISADDIKIAFKQGLLVKNDKTGEVTYTGVDYKGFYLALKPYCDTANVVYVNDRLLVWAFPPEIFKSFKSVTVLTYLFEGSLLASYFKYYNIPFKVEKHSENEETMMKGKIFKLLNIYEGVSNKCGDHHSAFCLNWLHNKSSKEIKKIKDTVSNMLQRNFKAKSDDVAFTTFKKFESKLKGKGYSKGFIPVNERATNKYAHKGTMVYLANRFLDPNIVDFFRSGNIKVDEDNWALAELLQWIWRGSIRNYEEMNLFIPSKRMRTLLLDWLNDTQYMSSSLAA